MYKGCSVPPRDYSPLVLSPYSWHRSTDEVYSDAGSTLATDTDSVQQWNDLSGNGHHLKQTGAGKNPVFSAAGGRLSRPTVTFDGSQQVLLTDALADVTSPLHVFLATQVDAYNVGNFLFDSLTTGNAAIQFSGGSPNVRLRGDGSSSSVQGITIGGGYRLVHVIFNGASSEINENASTGNTVSGLTSHTLDGYSLGGQGDETSPANMNVMEMLIFDSVISGDNFTNLMTYFLDRYGITTL